MEPPKRLIKNRRSSGSCARKSATYNFLKRIRNNSINNESDQETKVPRYTSKENKFQSNNEELAKALAKSHLKERELRDEISKMQEDHLELISKLQFLKQEQESHTLVMVKTKRAVMKKLMDATDVVTDLTTICMESAKEETHIPIFLDCPNQLVTANSSQVPDNHSKSDVADLEECLPKKQKQGESLAELLPKSRGKIPLKQSLQPNFEIISSTMNNCKQIEDSLIIVSDEEKLETMPSPKQQFESSNRLSDIVDLVPKTIDQPTIMQKRYPSNKSSLEYRTESCADINNSKSSCVDSNNQENEEEKIRLRQSALNKQLLAKKKHKQPSVKQNKQSRRKRHVNNKVNMKNVHSWCENKENMEPKSVHKMIKSNDCLENAKKQQVYISPFKKIANMILSPLETKSPIFRKTRLKRKVSYVEPSLSKKLRRGDPCSDSTLYSSPHIGSRKRARPKEHCQPLSDIGNSIIEED